MGTAAELLGSCLRAAGATRVFGSAASGLAGIEGLGHILVDDDDHAAVLAAAAGRLGEGPGVALMSNRRLLLTNAPGRVPTRAVMNDPGEIPAMVAAWNQGVTAAAVEIQMDLDTEAPAPEGAGPLGLDDQAATSAMTLGEDVRDGGLAVVGGTGTAAAGRWADLVSLATAAGVPVNATVGAAGVAGPTAGVVGLQEGDFAAAGIAEAPVVVAAGVDTEAVRLQAGLAGQVLEVPPAQLVTLGMRWPDAGHTAQVSPLAGIIAAAVEPIRTGSTDSPAEAATALAAAAGDALVAADSGPAALWMARAGIPAEPASLVLAEERAPGFAVAAAAVAALDGRCGLAVVTEPADELVAGLAERVSGWGGPLVLLRWGADGPAVEATEHSRAIRAARRAGGCQELAVPVDLAMTRSLVEALGPVSAWTSAAEANRR